MELLAELIGAYALAVLAALLAVGLGAVILLWRWLDRIGPVLWRWTALLWSLIADFPPWVRLRRRFPRLWAFLGRRLSPEGYLGLHFTIGIALVIGALHLFAELTEEIWSGEEIALFDQALAHALRRHASPAALAVFSEITRFGNKEVIALIGAVAGLLLAFSKRWFLLAGWTVALAGGGLLNMALKAIFRRTRPISPNPFITAPGWSFPSGHAMGALIAYGMLAYVMVILFQGKGARLTVSIAAALALLIGASRMYLGVHYFSDVIAGYVAGIAWLAVCITATEVARRHRRERSSPRLPAKLEKK